MTINNIRLEVHNGIKFKMVMQIQNAFWSSFFDSIWLKFRFFVFFLNLKVFWSLSMNII